MDLSVTWAQFRHITSSAGRNSHSRTGIAWGAHPSWEWIQSELGAEVLEALRAALARGETVRILPYGPAPRRAPPAQSWSQRLERNKS
jgi:hypothetical protein